MTQTIFWSWQSDLSPRETRDLIRDSLLIAIERLVAAMEESQRPSIDHDTKDVAGSPEIVATILKKIESASVFVADITPISVSDSGKHVSNPNVLIELGYAKHALGAENVILVWNTAISGCSVADLPFDLRHRRGPISYELPVGSPKGELRRVREELANEFERRLGACLRNHTASPTTMPRWQQAKSDDPSIWDSGEAALHINRRSDPPVLMGFEARPRAFARLLPERWECVERARSMLEGGSHLSPLGRYSSSDWGRTKGGFLAFRTADWIIEGGKTPTATRWFQSNGEIWGIASSFFSENDGYCYFAEKYAVSQWMSWLRHSITICRSLGGSGSMLCKMGVCGIEGTRWPQGCWVRGEPNVAVENDITDEFSFEGSENDHLVPGVRSIINRIRDSYGLDPYDPDDFEAEFRNG